MTVFPEPAVPVLPVLSWRAFGQCPGGFANSHWPGASVAATASGSDAISLALRHANIGKGARVIVPGYHCLSMVDAIRAAGAEPVFIDVYEDLAIDLDDAGRKLSTNTAALLAPHYFGFFQDNSAITAFCRDHSLKLIYDCAHLLPGIPAADPYLRACDYAVFSLPKYYPVESGGFLVSYRHDLSGIRLRGRGISTNVKAVLNALERSAVYKRFQPLDGVLRAISRSATAAARVARSHTEERRSHPVSSLVGDAAVAPVDVLPGACIADRLIASMIADSEITTRRRSNFAYLLNRLSGAGRSHPDYPKLADDVVPYMLPVFIERQSLLFPALKDRGVPIFRWEEIDDSDCGQSKIYSKSLLQIPVHQSLTESELVWLGDTLVDILQNTGAYVLSPGNSAAH